MDLDLLQSTTPRVLLKVYLASDHISDATGKTVAVVISKNGAAFGNPSGGALNATEIGNGWYYADLTTTDTGTLGPLIVRGTSASCDNAEKSFSVVKATNRGMSALPDTAVTTNASLITAGTGTAQLLVSAGLVALDKTQALSAARALDSIADTSLTLNDALHCAIAGATSREAIVGTAWTVKTPSTGTVLRTFTLDSATNPTSRT